MEFILECTKSRTVPVTGENPCLQIQGCCLRPSHYLSRANRTEGGEIDVTPEEGMIIECNLTPVARDRHGLHVTMLDDLDFLPVEGVVIQRVHTKRRIWR